MAVAFASCHKADDLLDGLDKAESVSYLRNENGQDVTVIMRPGRHDTPASCTWLVPKGSEVQIADTERWGLTQHVNQSDTVFFRFADGTEVMHYYIDDLYPSGHLRFVPAVGNIFSIGLDVPDSEASWTMTPQPHHRSRYEYVIR